jgi:hypothetical protein
MRLSRATLQRTTATLQADLEERITEGFWARVKRYFSDKELAKRLVLARAARVVIERA